MADLTDAKLTIIRRDWDGVKQNLKQNGLEFFIFFFKSNPGYQDMFKSLRGLGPNQFETSAALRSHALRVMYAISSLIDNLDDMDAVVEILKKTTQNHHPRNVSMTHFQHLFDNLIEFLGIKLGSGFGEQNRAAWRTLAGVMQNVISGELKVLSA